MKRPLDSPAAVGTPPKRARITSSAPLKARYRQPGDLLLPANPQDPAILDSLIDRSLAITLHTAGFDAVKRDAFESLRNAMDSYLTRITELTQLAMTSSRRHKIIPQDIEYALRNTTPSLRSLLPELPKPTAQKRPPKTSTVQRTLQPPLFPRAPTTSTASHFAFPGSLELSKQLGGTSDKDGRKWIPRHFPAFPPPHTYKSTSAPVSEREIDARKVREQATEEGVLAERALRKLVGARKKMGSRVGSRPGTSAGGACSGTGVRGKKQSSAAVFKEAMDAVLLEDKETGRESLQHEDEVLFFDNPGEHEPPQKQLMNGKEGEGDDMAFGALVNWDRAHWRSGARDVLAMS